MDRGECYAVYVDDRVQVDRWLLRKDCTSASKKATSPGKGFLDDEPFEFRHNVELFLQVFDKVYLCNSGKEFASKLAELNESSRHECTPIIALIDVVLDGPNETSRRSMSPPPPGHTGLSPSPASVRRSLTFSSQSEETYGLRLLSKFSSDLQVQDEPNAIVPIAVIRHANYNPLTRTTSESAATPENFPFPATANRSTSAPVTYDTKYISRCLDAGAVDVLPCPLDAPRVHGLKIHAYRAQKAAKKELSRFLATRKLRKQSWVGTDDQQPFAYLREAMVSKLMKRICNPEEAIEDVELREPFIAGDRKSHIEAEIGKWTFSAHEFSDDELVHAAAIIIGHALKMPELEHWYLTHGELLSFVLSSRAAYNSFVLYHNFRHAVDVLQSTFFFLLGVGALPQYPDGTSLPSDRSPVSCLLTPFDALTLLVTAIGHDVGHPGVNNIFLVKLNSPLAQLYNDNSVLEAFHCAAYSQILRRYWPAAFKSTQMRKRMISSILATDMGLHHKFIDSMGQLQQKYHREKTTEGWSPQEIEVYQTLLCGLIIKCADISNVARPWKIAERWTDILQQEFANQGEMEKTIGMETTLFGGPPELGNLVKLGMGQINFMGLLALPLFDGVADLLPGMTFAANEIKRNRSVWQELVDREKLREATLTAMRPPVAPSDISGPSASSNTSAYYTIPPQSSSPPASETPPALPQLDGRSKDTASDCDQTDSRKGSTESSPVLPSTGPTSRGDCGESSHDVPLHDETATHTSSSTCCKGRSNDQRAVFGHRPFQKSSGRVSVVTSVNRPSEGTSGVRTQSTSTYTNNTVMTPVSSTTQASSVVSSEGTPEEREKIFPGAVGSSNFPGSLNGSVDTTPRQVPGDESSRSTPVGLGPRSEQSNYFQRAKSDDDMNGSSRFMASLIDKSFGNSSSNANGHHTNGGVNISGPMSSPSLMNYPRPDSSVVPSPERERERQSRQTEQRTAPRRRSRLRLAFWRRNKQPQSSPTSAPNQTSDA